MNMTLTPAEYQEWREKFTALIKERFELNKLYTHEEAIAILDGVDNPKEVIQIALSHKDLLLTNDWCIVRRDAES